MKRIIGVLLAVCLLAVSLSASAENGAELVVFGTVYTAEEENGGLAEAFAVKDGKYVYVGNREGVQQYIQEGKTEIIDRTGEGLIIPGCTEGHSHYFGVAAINILLPGCDHSYTEMLEILKEQAESSDIRQFLTGGWKTTELIEARRAGKNFAEEIEQAAPGIPVVLLDNSGHSAVCNTTALKMAGLLDDPTVRGGIVDLDANGQPSGYVGDQAVAYVLDRTIGQPLTDEQYRAACELAVGELLSLGYTNVLDAWANMYHPSALYKALKELDGAGGLTLNLAACYNIKSYDAENYQAEIDKVAGIAEDYRSVHFDPAFIKLFADGVVESATGWMIGEYKQAERGKEHGNQIWSQDELNALVRYANSKGIMIHTHAYGDAACRAMLDAYIASNEANGGNFRNSIGHARNIRMEDVLRAAENSIPIAGNLIWHTDYAEDDPEAIYGKQFILSRVPEDVYYSGYPMKSLIANGIVLSSSTDAPAAMAVEGSIMNVLEVSVTGIQPHYDAQPFAEDELLTVREGLQALTINGAYQLGLEKERGSVKVGKYADFVILDKNILDYQGEELRTIGDTKILNTYFEGKNVYSAQ